MKKSTKKALKKFGKSLFEETKEVGSSFYKGTKEALRGSAKGIKQYFTEPIEKEPQMSSKDIDKLIKLEQLQQLREARMSKMQKMPATIQSKTKFERDLIRTQQFQRGAEEKLGQIIPKRQNITTPELIRRATFQPRRTMKFVPVKRRPVSGMLASDALRI